jgi:NAD(P)H-dependent flavin oxidoreductase YrpB (nitropropane dioxygenase family)
VLRLLIMIRLFNRLPGAVIAAMLWLTRFELAIAESSSSNVGYIRRLREDERRWMVEQFKEENARRFA